MQKMCTLTCEGYFFFFCLLDANAISLLGIESLVLLLALRHQFGCLALLHTSSPTPLFHGTTLLGKN